MEPPNPKVIPHLPPELVARIGLLLDSSGWAVLRQTCSTLRGALDSAISRLRVTYGSALPEQRPPEPVAVVARSLRGLMDRGCRPDSLVLRLEAAEEDRHAKGLAVLTALSATASLRELRFHDLPLDTPLAAPAIAAAAPGLTSLSLSGDCCSQSSLESGLPELLTLMPQLADLTLLQLPVDSPQPLTWRALRGHSALTSLSLYLCSTGALEAEAVAAFVHGLESLTQLRALRLEDNYHSRALGPHLPMVLSRVTGLRSLTLRLHSASENLFQCLTPLRGLETLSLAAPDNGVKASDVRYLPQLTALTALTLVLPLSPAGIDRAIAEASWALPTQLQTLRLGSPSAECPLRLGHLAALSLPASLRSVRLCGVPLVLPDQDVAQLAVAFAAKMAGRGLESLALRGGRDWSAAVGSLGALQQLQSLALHGDMPVRGRELAALAAAPLGDSLTELALHGCDLCPRGALPELLRLRGLRRLRAEEVKTTSWEPRGNVPKVPLKPALRLLAGCGEVVRLSWVAAAAEAEAARVAAALHGGAGDAATEAAVQVTGAAERRHREVEAAAVVAVVAAGRAAAAGGLAVQVLAVALQGLGLAFEDSAGEPNDGDDSAGEPDDGDDSGGEPDDGDDATPGLSLDRVLMEASLVLLVGRGVNVQLRSCFQGLTESGEAARDRVAGLGPGPGGCGGLQVRRR